MSENSQMIEQIFANIDSIGTVMETTVDLNSDVAPFMAATLAKIKQLALAKDGSYEAQYELFQIATNYLPRTLNAYCALPIEYRNTRIIKANKTARQLLIEDLKIFKTQVLEVEKQFYASIESQIKVNSSIIREKYENKFQLATELDNLGEDGFVNQFDFSTYQNSSDYKNITFKKEASEKELIQKQRNEKFNKAMETVAKTGVSAVSFGYKKIAEFFKIMKKSFSNFICYLDDAFFSWLAPTLAMIAVLGVILGFSSLIAYEERPASMYTAITNTVAGTHEVMSINVIPTNEFRAFIAAKEKDLFEDSDYRKERIKVNFDEKTKTVILNVADIDKDRCMGIIDHKEQDFDAAVLKVNGMDLPQDNTISDRTVLLNENHKLCHLKKGNKVTLELNNQKIYDYAKNNIPFSPKEKADKLAHMEKELHVFKNEIEKYSEGARGYNDLKTMINQIEKAITKLKEKPVNVVASVEPIK